MDRELWKTVLAAVKRAAKKVEREYERAGCRRRRRRFAEWLVAAMYLWCVWHDRPLCWACDRSHYGALFRPRKLPSVSQFTRRVKEDLFQEVLQAAHDELARRRAGEQRGLHRRQAPAGQSREQGPRRHAGPRERRTSPKGTSCTRT